MKIYNKFKKGLLTAASSFSLIWKHKKLLVYLGIPIFAHVIIEILTYNITFNSSCFFSQENIISCIFTATEPCKLLFYAKILLASFAYLAIMNFGYIALSYHTAMIHKKKTVGIKNTITRTFSSIKPILIWTALLLVPTILFYGMNTYNVKVQSSFIQLLYISFISAFFAAWSLVTSFVIQAIAIDHFGVIESIKKSIYIIKQILLEFVGTVFWLGLIGTLSIMPFVLLQKYANALYLIVIPLALLIYCTITSAYTVAKTLLYLDFKKDKG